MRSCSNSVLRPKYFFRIRKHFPESKTIQFPRIESISQNGEGKRGHEFAECTVAQKCHGNFNFTTAISTSFTAISTLSRQFQFHHDNFNFVHGNFNFTTAISISPRQFQFCHGNFNFVHGNFNFNFTTGCPQKL